MKAPRIPMDLRIIRANKPPTVDDVRELTNFLTSPLAGDEKALQHLLERHPSLVGVLGFCEFLSEVPLYKPDENNNPVLTDGRRRDRADLIAAEESPIISGYRSANIIELKGATQPIRERTTGFRLSDVADHATGQLEEYRSLLTSIPANRDLLKSIGWDVRWPELSLIMGRRNDFAENPGQYAEIRSRLQTRGVKFYTVDDMLDRARQHAEQRILPPSASIWSRQNDPNASGQQMLAGVLMRDVQMALEIAVSNPDSLGTMPRQVFNELVLETHFRKGFVFPGWGESKKPDTYFLKYPGPANYLTVRCEQTGLGTRPTPDWEEEYDAGMSGEADVYLVHIVFGTADRRSLDLERRQAKRGFIFYVGRDELLAMMQSVL